MTYSEIWSRKFGITECKIGSPNLYPSVVLPGRTGRKSLRRWVVNVRRWWWWWWWWKVSSLLFSTVCVCEFFVKKFLFRLHYLPTVEVESVDSRMSTTIILLRTYNIWCHYWCHTRICMIHKLYRSIWYSELLLIKF